MKRGVKSPVPHPEALVPLEVVNSKVLRESLVRLAQEVASNGFGADSSRRAAFDLLRRVPPRFETAAPRSGTSSLASQEGLAASDDTPLEVVRHIAARLDRSVLPVQGPPGSGKTYTGAQAILDLLADGKRVAVTANSHKVISNLLSAICRAADARLDESERNARDPEAPATADATVGVHGIQKAKDDDGCPDERIVQAKTNDEVATALATGEANLAGGTAWLWAGQRGDGRRGGRSRHVPRRFPRRRGGAGRP